MPEQQTKHFHRSHCYHIITVILCLLSLSAFPNDIDNVLKMTSAPKGVIFELIGSEDNKYLPNALKKVETYKGQLKKKFPAIEIAVVAHGAEQFELTKNNMSKNKESHNLVKRITADNVPVHICATHASWRGVIPTDFPEYVSVADRGPVQIKKYQELGYILIVVY